MSAGSKKAVEVRSEVTLELELELEVELDMELARPGDQQEEPILVHRL